MMHPFINSGSEKNILMDFSTEFVFKFIFNFVNYDYCECVIAQRKASIR